MNKTQFEKLKNQILDRYNKKVAHAEKVITLAKKERDEGLRSLDFVWKMLKQGSTETTSNNLPIPSETTITSEHANKYGTIASKIKVAMQSSPEEFTQNDIRNLIPDINDNTLYGYFARFEKQDFIEKTVQGKGRAPSKYKIKNKGLFTEG